MELAPAIVAKLNERALRYRELNEQISRPEVATSKAYPDLLREHGQLEQANSLSERLNGLIERSTENTAVLDDSDEDADLKELASEDQAQVELELKELEEEAKGFLVTDKEDLRAKIIVEIRAGTGGDEASLFSGDLYRIYRKFSDSMGWKTEDLEVSHTDVGGFKEVVFAIHGEGSWALMQFESGVHRVQRVPQTETQGRIHTSAATVAVLAEAEEAEIKIRDEDLRIDTMRAGGPGGQSVNKTSSAVRITHLPTDTVVICQDEKSQHKNKAKAMRILQSRLLDAERQRIHSERAETRKSQVGTGDRSARIRTYNYPQNRLTDHRLGENFSLEQVVAGKLGPIMEALAALEREERIRNL
ncbi:MAG: peptide chain release factor 1 [Planctomycetota bacterium]|nr:peptide chain release factor 1 [Planctomycetota bacterium]